MISEKNYNRMATEVLELLKSFPEEKVQKIPKSLLQLLESNKDSSHIPHIDSNKKLLEQDVCNETIILMYLIYRDFWASPEEKNKVNTILKSVEKNYNEKFSAENMFKKPNGSELEK